MIAFLWSISDPWADGTVISDSRNVVRIAFVIKTFVLLMMFLQ